MRPSISEEQNEMLHSIVKEYLRALNDSFPGEFRLCTVHALLHIHDINILFGGSEGTDCGDKEVTK
jgi:hypothetical protein